VIALALHSFDEFFDKDLKDKYGLQFKINDFLDKIKLYLSNSLVNHHQKHICLEFLMRFIDTSENKVMAQDLLDRIGFTKTTLSLLSESKFEDDLFSCKVIEFLLVLLRPGNRTIQKSVYNFFITNNKLTTQLFHHIGIYFAFFQKIVTDAEFIKHIKYDKKLKVVELLIELFRLLCENHFEPMQDYLRTQDNLRKRTNFLDLVCVLLKRCSSNPINKVYPLFLQSIDFLVEMLQGPCVANQVSLVDLNLTPTLTKIIKWKMNSSSYSVELKSSITITQQPRLVKLRMSKTQDESKDLDFNTIERLLEGRFRMDNTKIVTLKYKAILLANSMLEMMSDSTTIANIRKELSYSALKRLIIEVYIQFHDRYKCRYLLECLNHVTVCDLVRPCLHGQAQAKRKEESGRVHFGDRFYESIHHP
jgi:hypothetical protein